MGLPLSNESPTRQAIRLGLGTVITFTLAQLIQWPIASMAAAFTVIALMEPAPMSLREGWKVFWVSTAIVLAGGVVSLIFSPWPLLLVIVSGFCFYWMYNYSLGAGVSVLELCAALTAFTAIPVFVVMQPEVGFTAIWGFMIAYAVSILVSWFAWMCVPMLAPPPVAKQAVLPQEVISSAALTLSIVMSLLLALFLIFGWDQILMIVYASLFLLGLDLTGGRQMGFTYIIANVIYGGTAMFISYELLVMAPSFVLMVPIVFFVSCVFGYGAFRDGPRAGFWNAGIFGFIMVLGALLLGDNGYSAQALAGRVWQMILATAYVTLALSTAEMIKSWRKRRSSYAY